MRFFGAQSDGAVAAGGDAGPSGAGGEHRLGGGPRKDGGGWRRLRPAEERVVAANVLTVTPGRMAPVIDRLWRGPGAAHPGTARAAGGHGRVGLPMTFADGGVVTAGALLLRLDPAARIGGAGACARPIWPRPARQRRRPERRLRWRGMIWRRRRRRQSCARRRWQRQQDIDGAGRGVGCGGGDGRAGRLGARSRRCCRAGRRWRRPRRVDQTAVAARRGRGSTLAEAERRAGGNRSPRGVLGRLERRDAWCVGASSARMRCWGGSSTPLRWKWRSGCRPRNSRG